jgi:hypothetical protein
VTETAPEPQETEASGDSQGARIGTLEEKVDRILQRLGDLLPGHKAEVETAGPAGEEAPVAEQVKAELAKLKAAEDRKASKDKQSADIAELKDRVEKIKEKAPKEYRRVTTAVWGRDED